MPQPLSATISVIELQGMPPCKKLSRIGQPVVHFVVRVGRGCCRRAAGFIGGTAFGILNRQGAKGFVNHLVLAFQLGKSFLRCTIICTESTPVSFKCTVAPEIDPLTLKAN